MEKVNVRKILMEYFKCKISYYYPEIDNKYYPSVNDYTVEIKMPQEFYREYFKLQKNEIRNISGENDKFIEGLFFSGLRQAINNLWGKHNPKLYWIQNKLIENKKTKFKSVIYSSFKHKRTGSKVFMNHIIDFLEENKIPYGIISGDESKNKRNDTVIDYNNKKIQVLLITKAGGEGLDLKETHDVIIAEPYWNMEFLKQVKGRAIRYKSHVKLPKNLQYVDVYQLLLIKPDDMYVNDDMNSVDTILYENAEKKNKSLVKFYKRLAQVSIEENEC